MHSCMKLVTNAYYLITCEMRLNFLKEAVHVICLMYIVYIVFYDVFVI
jgi:hypothetical protein